MGKFNFVETYIEGLFIIQPTIFFDNRGFFLESYNYKIFKENGLDMVFVQENHSKSKKGVLRGIHFQNKYPQGKLIRVIKGKVFDVAVDLRKNSITYGKWYGLILSEENKIQFYVPSGFGHGFLVLSDEAEFLYKCTEYYHPEDENGILWNDPELNITWPIENINEIILSEKDKNWKYFQDTKIHF